MQFLIYPLDPTTDASAPGGELTGLPTITKLRNLLPNTESEFVNFLRSPGVDSQPGGIDSWAP